MKTVVVNWGGKPYVLQSGETEMPFLVTLMRTDSAQEDMAQKVPASPATFLDVPAGEYTATVSKLGKEAEAGFAVDADEQTVMVPVNVFVNVVSTAAAPPPVAPPGTALIG